MKKDPWRRFKLNTPEERMEYLANWFRGYKQRYGLEKAKEKLEEHPKKDAIRQAMRKVR